MNATQTAGQRAHEWIKARLSEGLTVYVATGTRATKVTSKTLARFDRAGTPLFVVTPRGELLMREGSLLACVATPYRVLVSLSAP